MIKIICLLAFIIIILVTTVSTEKDDISEEDILPKSAVLTEDTASAEPHTPAESKIENEVNPSTQEDIVYGLYTKMDLNAGQVAALTINSIQGVFKDIAQWNATTVASYNQSDNKIVVEIYGSRNSLYGARETTLEYVEKILGPMIESLNNSYGLSLTKSDFTVVYTNKHAKKQLLKYENNQYHALTSQ